GGVGGLLLTQTATTSAIPAYDGNGNVTTYLDAATGTPIADFEYGPFGELLRATGSFAKNAPFRFSTKFTDAETGLVYYGLRYYNSTTARWLSRDPMGELGGINLSGMLGNDPINKVDPLGLNPFVAAFADCAKSAIKSAALRYIYNTLRDSTICNQATNEIQGSEAPCAWQVFEPSNATIEVFDQRSLVSDAVDCYVKKLGSILAKGVDNDILRKLIEIKIDELAISDQLSNNRKFIGDGGIRIATRCLGSSGEVQYIAYWETFYLNFADRSTGQVLLPLSRRTCFSNNGALSRRVRQFSCLACSGCPDVDAADVPSWHPRERITGDDGFNRFPPLEPLDAK
ncbi:MAG: RHS repeat-associated core domain-containing protein, partial [Opitutaceae bacterium]